ncbi:MAG: elongation factor Ts [Candidatus Zambryskibacteria bacterium]|nr:elongation factor Ts [Candidatus Zambryskibacteria bacterium]
MSITTEKIKELRDATGVSIMQCKKALEEVGGDMEKAKIILRKISKQTTDKKASRDLGAGVIESYIHNNGSVGAMIELLCETDFVAKNEEFKALAREIAMHVAAMAPEYLKMEEVKDEEKVKARELFEKEMEENPSNVLKARKSKEIRDKIIEGKISSYFGEKVLLNQSFIKNPEMTVQTLIDGANQKFGERTEICRFVRFSIN